jgi:hypothetical protein
MPDYVPFALPAILFRGANSIAIWRTGEWGCATAAPVFLRKCTGSVLKLVNLLSRGASVFTQRGGQESIVSALFHPEVRARLVILLFC